MVAALFSVGGLPPGIPQSVVPPEVDEDSSITNNPNAAPKWGLYLNGAAVITAQNVVAIDYKTDANIPTYPQENGAFASYNKVQLPATPTIRFSAGGTLADRQALLTSAENAKQSLDLYDLVMPEIIFSFMNVEGYDFERRDGAYGIIFLDVHLIQILPTATLSYTTGPETPITFSANAGANNPANGGTVQGQTLTPAQEQGLDSLPVTDNPAIPQVMATVVPVQPIGNQTLTIALGGQSVQLNIYQKVQGLFMDVLVNNGPIISGVLCMNLNRIVRDLYLGFIGDFTWFDNFSQVNNQTSPPSFIGTDPVYTGLGTQYSLIYVEASELPPNIG